MKIIPILTIIVVGVGILLYIKSPLFSTPSYTKPDNGSVSTSPNLQTPVVTVDIDPTPEIKTEKGFKEITLTSEKPGAELVKILGLKNTSTVLAINRIDDRHLTQGMILTVPTSFENSSLWEFMPKKIDAAKNIPKLAIISQRTQAFGFYENGKLVRSGPISSGKKSTPTASGIYFTNWKGEEVTSTFDDEWILKWNFNIDNDKGISLHQYALPGYPASHSCVRFYERDAKWFYDWADEWVLSPDSITVLEKGTPVIVYGSYEFNKKAPWKRLLTDLNATKVSEKELTEVIENSLEEINQ